MDQTLKDFLFAKDYIRVKLKLTKTNHFEIKASRRSAKLRKKAKAKKFSLKKVKDSEILAAGAGAIGMVTQVSKNNTIKIGRLKIAKSALVLFDLSHVNTALINHNAQPVDGIIGADVLKKVKGIIDYEKKYLYLKKLV